MMSNSRSAIMIFLGALFAFIAVVLFVHDAEYIFTGNTVNLNEILETGAELPRDQYVTFTCRMPVGNYAETQEYLSGIIPTPSKTQQYALLDDTGLILSAEINHKSKIEELNQAVESFYHGTSVSVTVTGCLVINSSEMDAYLEDYINYLLDGDMESSGIILTSYLIDTTKTRLKIIIYYTIGFALGVFLMVINIRKMRDTS